MATTNANIFDGMKNIRDLTKYTLMRGVTDFANLEQYNLFEGGYSLLFVTKIPRFMKLLASKNTEYEKIVNNYAHVLEYEFRGIDGLDNITSDVGTITNGIDNLDIINKVTKQSNGTFNMRFQEKSGSALTKFHELFLTGIKDPRTGVKRYHGLIDSGELEPGYENEVFSFFYVVTDNTLMNIEKAFYIASAQPTTAELNIYNTEKGNYEFKELGVEFRGFPVTNQEVTKKSKEFLDWTNNRITWLESKYKYSGVGDAALVNGSNINV